MQHPVQVVVVGGGYSGVTAANRLAGHPDVQVTLVNPRAVFVERIRLHQLVAGSDDAVVEFSRVLAPSVRLLVDAVERIDAPGRRLLLASGETLAYDRLVYAVGSGRGIADVPGAAAHAYPIADLQQAERLRTALAERRDRRPPSRWWERDPPASRWRRSSPSTAAQSPSSAPGSWGHRCTPVRAVPSPVGCAHSA